jgi:serine protease Do
MKSIHVFLLSISLTSAIGPAQASGILSAELPDLVEKILPGVVNISTVKVQRTTVYGMDEYFKLFGVPQEQQQQSMGSGFIISKDGYVLTNNHVIEEADEVLVTLLNKKTYKARIIGKDPKLDLALLRIRDDEGKTPSDLSPLSLGNSDLVRIAEPVFAVGNPFGLQHTVTTGIISAKNRTIGLGPLDNFLQTDASINPGNSGGPLFNFKGEVIGMNTSIFSRTGQSAGLGFSIPVNEAKKVLEDLKKFGRVPRPWIGILGQSVSPRLQAYYQLPVSEGVLIVNLVSGAPGILSGLTRGDIVVQVDGDKVSENADIEREIYRKRPNETVTVKVRRGRKTLDFKIKLDEIPKLDNAKIPQGLI